MVLYSKIEQALAPKLFKFKQGNLYYNSNLPMLLKGRGELDNLATCSFIPLSSSPIVIKKIFTPDVCRAIDTFIQCSNYESAVLNLTFESYFLTRLKILFLGKNYYTPEDYRYYQSIYAQFDYLSSDKVVDLAKLHSLLILIWQFMHDKSKLKFIFDHLKKNTYGVDIPLTSFDSFHRYLRRKRSKGLPAALTHGLYGRPSNNHEITPFMKKVLVYLATMIPTRAHVYSIKEDLDYLIQSVPSVKEVGIYSLSESKISSFLKEPEAGNLIRFAKDDPIEFRREVIGVMRFTRASAPLVRIYIDGYNFQVQYKNGKIPDRLTGVFISDDFSNYIVSHVIGDSENYDLVMAALRLFFEKTKGELPREIVVDKYTYRIISKNKSLIELLKRYGIEKGKGLIVSSNPNAKAMLERFFGTFQQRFMPSSIHYIGPSIKSKQTHSHPFRDFRVHLQKNLPERFDLILELNKLIKVHFNKEYISPRQSILATPENRFKEWDSNPLAKIDMKLIIPILFFELHSITVKAGAVLIRRGNDFLLYYLRDFDFINKYNGKKVDGYIDTKEGAQKIHLYEENCNVFIAEINQFRLIPIAAFDRTEDDKFILTKFSKESMELLLLFEEELIKCEETVRTALNGIDIRNLTNLARRKKEQSLEQDLADQVGISSPKKDPILFHANKSRRNRRGVNALEELGIDIVGDTF